MHKASPEQLAAFVRTVQKIVMAEVPQQNFLVASLNPLRGGLKLLLVLKKVGKLTNRLDLKLSNLSVTIQQQLAKLVDFRLKSGVSLTEATHLRSLLLEKDFEGHSLLWYINETQPEELL